MCFWLVSSCFYDQKICDDWSLAAMFNEVTSKNPQNNKKKTKTKSPTLGPGGRKIEVLISVNHRATITA